eukprot:TRINITY_DN112_c1_g2_i1.p1 TRINITY_DN112_c1_g2~~TRINITY_DN112_c1_g2_i1.p1  ORF type:complete len:657 (+),score=140.79 TRINITY_DN112_c1_g2_i1:83-1972(+)
MAPNRGPLAAVLFAACWAGAVRAGADGAPHRRQRCDAVLAKHAAVATSNADATAAGIAILRGGGNAFDAAVAVHFALAVTQPQSTGIAGGAFAMISKGAAPAPEDAVMLDGREEAPAAFHPNIFCRNSERCLLQPCSECPEGASMVRSTGGLSVGVPGFVAMSYRLLADHGSGRVSWAEALEHARRLADEGFPMYASLHSAITLNRWRLMQYNASRAAFLPMPGDLPVPVGEVFRQRDLGRTIAQLQRDGPQAFYDGDIAKDIVAAAESALNSDGQRGVMAASDLSGYRAVYRRPTLHQVFLGGEQLMVAGAPPPSSGGTIVGGAAHIVSLFDLPSYSSPHAADFVQRSVDAQALMWADRSHWLADADFVDVPLAGLANLTYLNGRAESLLHPLQAPTLPLPHGEPPGSAALPPRASFAGPDENGTLHFTIVDEERNVVAVTSTIEAVMGSAVVVPGRGLLLNNELTDFTPLGSDEQGRPYANRPEGGKRERRSALGADSGTLGGKRPLSSMAPVITFAAGRPTLALGSPGGTTIPSSVLSALLAAAAFRYAPQAAVDAPRHRSNNANPVLEAGLYDDPGVLDVLRERGYSPTRTASQGSVQLIELRSDGRLCAAADTTRSATAQADGF